MANTIQIKRGAAAGLPALGVGEPAFTSDTYKLYVGSAAGNKLVGAADFFLPLAGGTMTGAIAMGTSKITGLGNPTDAQDAATKAYIDNFVSGINAKPSVKLATVAVLPACTPAGSGPTHTLTADAVGVLAVDGINTVLGDRILVKNQVAQDDNGIYSVTTEGTAGVAFVLTRTGETDTWAELISAYCWVQVGNTVSDTGWVCTIDAGGTLETTEVTWVQFTGAPMTHTQNTDTGTTSATFQLLSGDTGPKIKGISAGAVQFRNAADNAYTDIACSGVSSSGSVVIGALGGGPFSLQIWNAAATFSHLLRSAATAERTINFPDDASTTLLGTSSLISALTTVGAIDTGSWHGTTIAEDHGGTGVAQAAGHTITVAGPFSTAGHFSIALTASADTAITLPTTGTLATTAQLHTKNTDTGTTSSTFQLDNDASGPLLKETGGAGAENIAVRDSTDAAYRDFSARSISVVGGSLYIGFGTETTTITTLATAARAVTLPDLAGGIILDTSTIDGGTW